MNLYKFTWIAGGFLLEVYIMAKDITPAEKHFKSGFNNVPAYTYANLGKVDIV